MLLFTSPRIRRLLGLPTARTYHAIALDAVDASDKLRPRVPLTPAYVACYREAIYPARMAYLLAVRQRADAQTQGVRLRSYLTVCLNAHRPDLVNRHTPALWGMNIAAYSRPEREEIVRLLADAAAWRKAGIVPAWLVKTPKTPQKTQISAEPAHSADTAPSGVSA
jgi:hypothetical protein